MSKPVQKPSPAININLLPQEKFDEEGLGKVVAWLLTVGRYLVIVTEIIVLIVFAMRFKLDEDKRVLAERIGTEQKIVLANSKLESDVRVLQARLTNIKNLSTQHSTLSAILSEVSAIFPKDGKLKDLGYQKDKVIFKGELLTPESLQALINSFGKSTYFKDLEISDLITPNPKSPVYTFSASITPIISAFKDSEKATLNTQEKSATVSSQPSKTLGISSSYEDSDNPFSWKKGDGKGNQP
ncbi:MAG: hypothetical protein M1150_02980 [Patescibacteria group bacterium]|nr:hypothetical protein [Patescibacteria group bacterium]